MIMENIKTLFIAVLFLTTGLVVSNSVFGRDIGVSGMKVEYMENPVGIDIPDPRLSWIPVSSQRGCEQSAYHIEIAKTAEELVNNGAKVWDTGKTLSAKSYNITYEGPSLVTGETYYWRVRLWDQKGEPGEWSKIATFHVGPMDNSDWEGVWIGPPDTKNSSPLLRREFTLDKPVREAYAYIVGLGYYELYLNGEKVGDHVLDPGTTDYSKRVLYAAYDVTDHLQKSKNAVGVWLGNGWFIHHMRKQYEDRCQMIFQLIVKHTDGSVTKILSDGSWKVGESPIIENNIYNGEVYDARKEKPGWNKAGYDDSGWKDAVQVKVPAGRKIDAQLMPPMRVITTLRAVRMWEPVEGIYVFDFGQDITGWPRMNVKGGEGNEVLIRTSPTTMQSIAIMKNQPITGLTDTLDVSPNRSSKARNIYTLRGDNNGEVYEPRFTYQGFRYVQLEGYPGTPDLTTLEARVVYSDVPREGTFSCSNSLLNQIHSNIIWGQLGNLHSVPTDTPHRDERLGWMGDGHLTAEEAILNFDMAAFYTKWLKDIQDDQNEDGSVPDFVPHATRGSLEGTPAWQVAYPLLVNYMYHYYGDKRIVEQHFNTLDKWMGYMKSISEDLIIHKGRGDWVPPRLAYSPRDNSVSITSTGYYYESAVIMSELAEVLGNDAKVQEYTKLAVDIKEAFNKKYFNQANYTYGTGSQTSIAFPLYAGIVDDEVADKVANNLAERIIFDDGHLQTGILGTKALVQVLPEFGMDEVLYNMTATAEFPGWGYMVAKGATTLWERWGGYRYFGPAMNSLNHIMFGSIDEFFYKDIAGIRMVQPGFEEISIAPKIVGDLNSANASVRTVKGQVSSSWKKTGNSVILNVEVPVGSKATIKIPKENPKGSYRLYESGMLIWEEGQSVQQAEGISKITETGSCLEVEAGSGSYSFRLN
jgi:alpha-L-rhamnosidase